MIFRPLALASLLATTAQAQVAQPPAYGASAFERHRYQADRHRLELDQARLRADERDLLASQIALESRLARLRVEAARQPEPVQPQPWRALRTPEEERALRLSAGDRRAATEASVGQIDAWLDRGAE